MCDYCENGKTFYDSAGSCAEIRKTNKGHELEAKTDGVWAGVFIFNCPWCGRDLKGGA